MRRRAYGRNKHTGETYTRSEIPTERPIHTYGSCAQKRNTHRRDIEPGGAHCKRVIVGVCGLWPAAEPSQSKRKGARSLTSRQAKNPIDGSVDALHK